MNGSRTVVALMGPTASGKTDLALRLAQRFRVGLISVDSTMVYRGMNIGTAKPPPEVLLEYPHAIVDIRDPEDGYSANEFLRDADEAIERAFADKRVPLLVGGTMMYFRSFRDGISTLPTRDDATRANLRAEAKLKGVEALHERLAQVDPDAAAKIHPNNYVRIERALEVIQLTGKRMSELQRTRKGAGAQERLNITLEEFALADIAREELHERVAKRLLLMFESGFVDEVRRLMNRPGLNSTAIAMRAVGYQQLWEALASDPKLDPDPSCMERILYATRRLVRRQSTWLRSWPDLDTEHMLSNEDAYERLCRRFVALGVAAN